MIFPDFPADARVWLYTARDPLTPGAEAALLGALRSFFGAWRSHGRIVRGEAAVLDHRFIAVTATVEGGSISGCGIDQHVREVERVAAEQGLAWASGLDVAYRDANGAVRMATRAAFRALGHAGEVGADTPVFALDVNTLEALQSDFERPAAASWHAGLLPMTAIPT